MISEYGNGFYAWNGRVYQSDIVRACLRPKVKAVGKLVGKHIRESVTKDGKKLDINPEAYIKFLLSEPNPYMTGQKLQEKIATQLCLNNNAFILILRDENGYPTELYPLPAISAEAEYDARGTLSLKFAMVDGKMYKFLYTDIIHLRQDFNSNDLFGDSISDVLTPLMQIITTTDQGIVNAIKNSAIIQWLLKFSNSMRPEDIKQNAKEFADNYLSIESTSVGVAAVDSKADIQRIEPKEYIPNAVQMDRTVQRIYSLFNTNDKIVQSKYSEDEWNSYYEAEIEPIVIELSGEYTRKIFSRRERGFGNAIVFEASNLATASMSTKLGLVAMVDRGAMLVNEWRKILNLAPIPGGDVPIRRLDTAVVNQIKTLLNKMDGKNDKNILNTVNNLLATIGGGENN